MRQPLLIYLLCLVAITLPALSQDTYAQIDQDGDGGPLHDGFSNPWIVPGQLTVGDTAIGSMSVTGAFEIQSGSGSIGGFPGGQGAVTIDGAGARWLNSGGLLVGGSGVGTLDIQNGGFVSSSTGTVSQFGDTSGDMIPSIVTIDGAGSAWDVTGDFILAGNSSAANTAGFENGIVNIQNDGSLTVGGALTLWDDSRMNVNGGSVEVGTLDLSAPGATDNFNFSSGTLSVENVVGNLIQNGGVFSQTGAGLTSIDGDLELNNTTIQIELGGLNRGTEYDAIDVTGTALLNDVTIEVLFIDGFTSPGALQEEFDILDGFIDSNSTVTFDFSQAPLDGPSSYWDTSRFISDGIITAIPEPSGLVVLAVASTFFMRRKRSL